MKFLLTGVILRQIINPKNITFFILVASFTVLACSSAPPETEYTYLEKGNEYLGYQGQHRVYVSPNFLAAIKEYDKALEINPELVDAIYNRGKSYHGLGKYENSIKDFTTLINKNPGNDEYYVLRSSSYIAMAIEKQANPLTNDPAENDYQLSITDATKALELNPANDIAYYNRGKSYYGLKNYQQSIIEYNKCLELNPDNGTAINDKDMASRMLIHQPKTAEDYSNIISSNETETAKEKGLGTSK